ncbi:Fc.00g069600.m01.CDS01 [Cosmosporella sp. VM-42]
MDPSSGSPRPAEDAPIPSDVTAAPEEATTSEADTQHLARFEFSDHGTKILMVEWYPGAVAAVAAGADSDPASDLLDNTTNSDVTSPDPEPPTSKAVDATSVAWEVSWPGKSTVVPVTDTETSSHRRVYFLLPPNSPVPATITVTAPCRTPLTLKPLPAIFPEGFSPDAGTRGVLHTIWAKKRLSELEREMEAEMRTNAESVGLEMAMAEKQWIVDNFLKSPVPLSPVAARSSVGGRLGDKLRGLRLATSAADLVPSPTANTFTHAGSQSQTLSPQGADIAVSSFSAMARGNTAPISLNAALQGDQVAVSAPVRMDRDAEDDLFALPLSPRSPDMKKSPFSAL